MIHLKLFIHKWKHIFNYSLGLEMVWGPLPALASGPYACNSSAESRADDKGGPFPLSPYTAYGTNANNHRTSISANFDNCRFYRITFREKVSEKRDPIVCGSTKSEASSCAVPRGRDTCQLHTVYFSNIFFHSVCACLYVCISEEVAHPVGAVTYPFVKWPPTVSLVICCL